MKRLLTFLLFIQLTATAQDSTSISFSIEAVQEFKKQNLMDEYERAFGDDRKVNTRFKAGLIDFPFSKSNTLFPFASLEQKVGNKFSLSLTGIAGTMHNNSPDAGKLLKGREKMSISLSTEIRCYFKNNSTLSGNYIGMEFKKSKEPSYFSPMNSFIHQAYYLKSQGSLNIGKQFGSVLDMGIQLGLKNVLRPGIDETGFMSIYQNDNKTLVPFLGMFSKIGLGLEMPFDGKKEVPGCEFRNCYTEFRQLFKVNLSNLFYLDPYFQNLKLDVAYERKIGRLPLSVNADFISTLNGERNHKPVSQPDNGTNVSRPKSQTIISFSSTVQLRYYFLQKQAIAKGRSASNLSGIYAGVFHSRFFEPKNQYQYISSPLGKPLSEPVRYTSGPVIGLQRKILKNYYYDFSLQYNIKKKEQWAYPGMSQNIKFGYSF